MIEINEVNILPKDNNGYRQFDNGAFDEMMKEHGLEKQSISHVTINSCFSCSSANVVNGVFDQIGQRVNVEDQGLLSLKIWSYSDKNRLEEWPLSQLLTKAPFLKSLKIS